MRLALRGERIGHTGLGRFDGGVTVTIRKEEDRERAPRRSAGLGAADRRQCHQQFQPRGDLQVSNTSGLTYNLVVTDEAIAARNTRTLQQSIEIIRTPRR